MPLTWPRTFVVIMALFVVACSTLVVSSPSNAEQIEDQRAPSPPTDLRFVTSGEESVFFGPYRRDVTVFWSDSADPGTAPISHYRLTLVTEQTDDVDYTRDVYRKGYDGYFHVGFSFRVGSDRTVQVVAVSAAGDSEPATIVVPLPPEPPLPPQADATSGAPGGQTHARVNWSPSYETGGAALSRFDVAAIRVRGRGDQQRFTLQRIVRTTPDERAARLRLPRGRYRFAVRSVNAAGPSKYVLTDQTVHSR